MPEIQSPYLVDWAITDKCNLCCRHCRGMSKRELSTERAKKLVAEIAELKPGWVIVEGGEPLLREDLFELLSLMRQSQVEVHLITNGMLLSPQILSTLKFLGIKVMVSIDGATPETYEEIGRIQVHDRGRPVTELNELEYVEGEIFANVWLTNRIARIDPATGRVTGWIDLAGLLSKEDLTQPVDVLNGIAYDDEGDRLFVTGKLWPRLFEIELVMEG